MVAAAVSARVTSGSPAWEIHRVVLETSMREAVGRLKSDLPRRDFFAPIEAMKDAKDLTLIVRQGKLKLLGQKGAHRAGGCGTLLVSLRMGGPKGRY